MNEHKKGADPEALEELEAALSELEQRTSGEFDGLRGSFPENKSMALADIAYYLRDYLLDRYDEPTVRHMQTTYSENPIWVPASEGVELAISVLHSIHSAFAIDGERFHILLSGRDGWSGAKWRKYGQKGGKKGGATQKRQRGTSVKIDEILNLARQDKERKRGWKVRISEQVPCSTTYVRNTLKKYLK